MAHPIYAAGRHGRAPNGNAGFSCPEGVADEGVGTTVDSQSLQGQFGGFLVQRVRIAGRN